MGNKLTARDRVAQQLGELLLINIEQAARIDAMAEQLRAAEQPVPAMTQCWIQPVDLSNTNKQKAA